MLFVDAILYVLSTCLLDFLVQCVTTPAFTRTVQLRKKHDEVTPSAEPWAATWWNCAQYAALNSFKNWHRSFGSVLRSEFWAADFAFLDIQQSGSRRRRIRYRRPFCGDCRIVEWGTFLERPWQTFIDLASDLWLWTCMADRNIMKNLAIEWLKCHIPSSQSSFRRDPDFFEIASRDLPSMHFSQQYSTVNSILLDSPSHEPSMIWKKEHWNHQNVVAIEKVPMTSRCNWLVLIGWYSWQSES